MLNRNYSESRSAEENRIRRACLQHNRVLDLLTKQCRVPRVLVTDKLRSYQVAHRAVMPSVEHRQSRYLNRAENSHQPTRQRERAMKRFRTPGGAQRFLAQRDLAAFPAPPPSPHRR